MLSLPQRLHLIGKFFTSVSGSNHSTVCLLHTGHRKRRLFVFNLSIGIFSCNSYHLIFLVCDTTGGKQKSLHHNRIQRYMAQALRRRRRLRCPQRNPEARMQTGCVYSICVLRNSSRSYICCSTASLPQQHNLCYVLYPKQAAYFR